MLKEKINYFKENEKIAYIISNKVYNSIRAKKMNLYIEKDDIVQESLIALFKAANNYDPSKNVKFMSYAYKCIYMHLSRYIRNMKGYRSNFIIKPPDPKESRKILEYINKNKLGFENLSDSDISKISNLFNIPVQRLRITLAYYRLIEVICVDIHEFEEFLKFNDKNLDILYFNELKGIIKNILKELSPKESDMVMSYYGLGKKSEKNTLESIGARYGVSKTRVSQILNRATKKMRNVIKERQEGLRDYLS